MMASSNRWRRLSSSKVLRARYSSRLSFTGSEAFSAASSCSVMASGSGQSLLRSANSVSNVACISEDTLPTTEKSMLL